MRLIRNAFSLLSVAAVLFCMAGCADIKPWEKGTLARPEMTFEGDPMATKFSEHIYSSKEASSGGAGVGGGGCGCN